jgi:hypothetical protein
LFRIESELLWPLNYPRRCRGGLNHREEQRDSFVSVPTCHNSLGISPNGVTSSGPAGNDEVKISRNRVRQAQTPCAMHLLHQNCIASSLAFKHTLVSSGTRCKVSRICNLHSVELGQRDARCKCPTPEEIS